MGEDFIRQPGNMQAMTLFKNLKVTNTLHKNEKNEKVQLLFKPEINEFKKYYELNKQLESQVLYFKSNYFKYNNI